MVQLRKREVNVNTEMHLACLTYHGLSGILGLPILGETKRLLNSIYTN